MFRKFSLFGNDRNKEDKASAFGEGKVFPIEPSHILLKTTKRKQLLIKIKQLSQAPDIYFKSLYQNLIDKLADYLQALPDILTYNTPLCSAWIDAALAKTAYALALRHRINLPSNASKEVMEKDYALWTYVIFSSSLMWQIGKLSTHFFISICNAQGMVTKQWQPTTQSLYLAGNYYKIRNIDPNGSISFKAITTVLAQQIMPKEGFNWIAANEQALEYWLQALVAESGAQGKPEYILNITKEIYELDQSFEGMNASLEKLISEDLLLLDDLSAIKKLQEKNLLATSEMKKSLEPTDTQLGEEFIRWIQRGLADKSIPYNGKNDNVHMLGNGIVLAHPEIFRDFCNQFHRHINWIVVYKQFNALGLHKKSGNDTWFGKFFIDANNQVNPNKSEKTFEGIMIENKRALLGEKLAAQNSSYLKMQNNSQEIKHEPEYPVIRKKSQGLKDTY